MIGFVGCLVLMVLSFAYAYGLWAAGIWLWFRLHWIAGGKSSWDISVILGISERAVNWLIANPPTQPMNTAIIPAAINR